jgi:hypothetical protein
LGTHGRETSGRDGGFRHQEYYNNTLSQTINVGQPSVMSWRGGTGYAWNNAATVTAGSLTRVLDFNTYREKDGRWWFVWGACGREPITSITRGGSTLTLVVPNHNIHSNYSNVNIAGANEPEFNITNRRATYSGGDANQDSVPDANTPITITSVSGSTGSATGSPYFTSPWDGNTDEFGYPCLSQLGRGKGTTIISGDEPTTPFYPDQALEPAYCANNTVGGSLSACALTNGTSDVMIANRDYYNQVASGFDGSAGVGRGPIGSIPGSCTDNVAYLATDEGTWDTLNNVTADGKWYLCVGGAWTPKYGASTSGEPYTYPHPLTNTVPTVRYRFRSFRTVVN